MASRDATGEKPAPTVDAQVSCGDVKSGHAHDGHREGEDDQALDEVKDTHRSQRVHEAIVGTVRKMLGL